MVTRLLSGTLWGVDGRPVTVEVDVTRGLPAFDIVGLAGPAVREARERVRAGLKNAGFEFPLTRITVNLAPADLRKQGTGFDLAIALGILHQTGQIPGGRWQRFALLAELSLSGSLQPLRGVLPILYHLHERDTPGALLATASTTEAAILSSLEIVATDDLPTLVRWLKAGCPPSSPWHFQAAAVKPPTAEKDGPAPASRAAAVPTALEDDLAYVEGQPYARRALEISAAGGHNLLMVGAPGTGKSTLARCLPSILPPPTEKETLEILLNYSAAGEKPPQGADGAIVRPYRAPHHNIPPAAMVGGGPAPQPGEISLAHRGVLFLDELAQFQRRTLEALREPLAEGQVTVTRLQGTCHLPATITLVAAMNPCPCGYFGDAHQPCRCTELARKRYWATLSGPLLDRIDIQASLARPRWQDLFPRREAPESSAQVASRVMAAREIQAFRLQKDGLNCNADMGRQQIERYCRPDEEGQLLLQEAYKRTGLTLRGYWGVLRLARTIADLAGAQEIDADHLAQALDLRRLDRLHGWWQEP